MALKIISKFNWEKFLAETDHAQVHRKLNVLRAKANEIISNSGKYGKEPEPIDFEGYKNKLKFTSSAVDALENAYKTKSIPTYHAALPAFQAAKREAMLKVLHDAVELAKDDINAMNQHLEEFDKIRITEETTYEEICDRFPHLAREVELEIKEHRWINK